MLIARRWWWALFGLFLGSSEVWLLMTSLGIFELYFDLLLLIAITIFAKYYFFSGPGNTSCVLSGACLAGAHDQSSSSSSRGQCTQCLGLKSL